jgi:hypothetical protein
MGNSTCPSSVAVWKVRDQQSYDIVVDSSMKVVDMPGNKLFYSILFYYNANMCKCPKAVLLNYTFIFPILIFR